jgi:solute carrier family 23 (nucleobase transporter), member 1
MRELQGAILVGSVFQIILGYTGLISLFLRYVQKHKCRTLQSRIHLTETEYVQSLTSQVNKSSGGGTNYCCSGFGIFSYGFPQACSCVEISMPLILLVLLCTLVYPCNSLLMNKT